MKPTILLGLLAVAATNLAAAQEAARIDSALRVLEKEGLSGVVRIERRGQIILERGYGLANRATKTPFTPATVVQIGSNTKDLTDVAILQLQERGKLSLADSLGRFFPEAPPDKRGITITQLLDHRSGFPANLGGDFEPIDRARFLARALAVKLESPPGTKENYSNAGYSLLAAIIETTTGASYERFIRDNILVPLGLTHTGLVLPAFDPAGLAHGYGAGGADDGTMLAKPHAEDGSWWNLRGNGGLLSTVGEMAAFYHGLLDSDRLLRPSTRALRFQPNQPIGLAGSDGVCFFSYDRYPRLGLEIIMATTNAEVRMPKVRAVLERALGL